MGQSTRLTSQHKKTHGVLGIFGDEAQEHDGKVSQAAAKVYDCLKKKYPFLNFRIRKTINKSEINDYLQKIDKELGQTLFLTDASIRPDGGIIEVKDDNNNWHVILVSEAKFQEKTLKILLMENL